jgi:hypothetical protein
VRCEHDIAVFHAAARRWFFDRFPTDPSQAAKLFIYLRMDGNIAEPHAQILEERHSGTTHGSTPACGCLGVTPTVRTRGERTALGGQSGPFLMRSDGADETTHLAIYTPLPKTSTMRKPSVQPCWLQINGMPSGDWAEP